MEMRKFLAVAAAGVLAWGCLAGGAGEARAAGLAGLGRAPVALSGPIDVDADSLAYDLPRRLVIGTGHVKVTCGPDSVKADYAEVDTEGGEVYARGHILVSYQGNTWTGDEVRYNFRTGVGDFGGFEAYVPPFHVTAEDSRAVSTNLVALEGVVMTTCEPDNLEYSVRASSATLEDGNILRAKNVRFNLGPVPIFWFPYVKAGLDWFDNFEFVAGAGSKLGGYLLTTYNHAINDRVATHTHFDIRTKRGVGVGEDVTWEDPDMRYSGILRLYYAYDNKPWKDDEEKTVREKIADKSRYWVQLKDRHSISSRDYVIGELNYLADPWLLPDFFDDLYQSSVVPENRITVAHVGDSYSAAIGLNHRLNDFYENVNRMPEVSLDFNRMQVFDTPFYYEGENEMSYLEYQYPKKRGRDGEDYDAIRFDTYHSLYWPTRQFGFLSVIPRARWRGTYYSKTKETHVATNVVAVTNLDGTAAVSNEVVTTYSDGDAAFRSLPEVGLETSYKAFRTLYTGPTGMEEDRDLRHVAEPYADYTLRFEPDDKTKPENLWQFDEIDKLDKANEVKLGMRNKLQTHRKGDVHSLIYLDTYLLFLLDPDKDKGEKTFDSFVFEAEIRPWSWMMWDINGTYDAKESEISTLTTQVQFRPADLFRLGFDYRYAPDRRNQLTTDLTLFPQEKWSFRTYVRADFDESDVEEHGYYLIHKTRCLGIGLGVRIRPDDGPDGDDDYSVWFRIWPLAFSGSFTAMP